MKGYLFGDVLACANKRTIKSVKTCLVPTALGKAAAMEETGGIYMKI